MVAGQDTAAVSSLDRSTDNALDNAVEDRFNQMHEPADGPEDVSDEAVTDVAEPEPGEADEVPEPTDEGDEDAAEEGEVEPETEEESDLKDETTDEPEEDDSDLTPRDEDGKYAKRFTPQDPNELPEEVKPYYKSMQADYTRKLQEVADLRSQVQEQATQYEETMAEVDALAGRLNSREGLRDFLIEAYLADPEAFAAAQERVHALESDPRERELTQRELNLQQQEAQRQKQQRLAAVRQRNQLVNAAVSKIAKVEQELGLPYDTIENYVVSKAEQAVRSGQTVTEADLDRFVNELAEPIRNRIGSTRKQGGKSRQDYVKNKARQNKKKGKASPKSGAPAQPKPKDSGIPQGEGVEKVFDALFERRAKEAGL